MTLWIQPKRLFLKKVAVSSWLPKQQMSEPPTHTHKIALLPFTDEVALIKITKTVIKKESV